MKPLRFLILLMLLVCCQVGGGCRHSSKRPNFDATVRGPVGPPLISPVPFPVAGNPPPAIAVPPPVPIQQEMPPSYTPKKIPWEGSPPQVYLMVPEPAAAAPEMPPLYQRPSQPTPLGPGTKPFPESRPAPITPSLPKESLPASPSLPVGIPQFAGALPEVYTGLRPELDGGLDWLQKNGFKTVLQIKLPGTEDSFDRKQVEKRDMTYLTLEVSPQALDENVIGEFNRIVSDRQNYPLFVYDRDGSLAGSLWYLYFRKHLSLPEDAARLRANGLGLRENRDGAHRDMWLAVQMYLSRSP
jgi:protein tyrosine phosphatase (PTP) superfamily phosphohydrolase (DUF442 family)